MDQEQEESKDGSLSTLSSTPRRNSASSESSTGSNNSNNNNNETNTNTTAKEIKEEDDDDDVSDNEDDDKDQRLQDQVNSAGSGTNTNTTTKVILPLPEPVVSNVRETASYAVKWNNYSSVLQNVFRRLLISQQFSDVVLACEGGESIKCHRILLAACSSYFEKILTDYHTSTQLVIFMKDIKLWQLRALVNFMYNGEVSVKEDQLESFMKAAESFNINGLDLPSSTTTNNNNNVAEAGSSSSINNTTNNFENDEKSTKVIKPKRIVVFPPTNRINQQELDKPKLTPQIGAPVPRLVLKRKVGSDGPPKLIKMPKIGSKPNGMNRLDRYGNSSSETAVLKHASRDVLAFERALLAQELANEDEHFDDVEKYMEKVVSEEEEVDQEEDGIENGEHLQYDDPPSLENENIDLRDGLDNEEQQQYDDDDAEDYGLYEMEEGNEDNEEGDKMNMQFLPQIQRPAVSPPRSRNARIYAPELQEAAFDALRNGVSIRQCSELFGITRKTLAKWKNRGLHLQGANGIQMPSLLYNGNVNPPKKRGPPVGTTLIGPESIDRAQRLQKATKLALSGVTVRQAAAQFNIPRTTLCAYMKRQGIGTSNTKRPALASNMRPVSASTSSNNPGFSGSRRIGSTVITLNKRNEYGIKNRLPNLKKQNAAMAALDEEIPFLGLSDFIEQIGDN